MMLLSLDSLAHRYSMLPSEALARASTFDLYTLDIQSKWVKYQHELHKSGGKQPIPKLSEQQMLDMIKRARGQL